jgi:hypothetical protein
LKFAVFAENGLKAKYILKTGTLKNWGARIAENKIVKAVYIAHAREQQPPS